MQLRGLHHVTAISADLERTVAFYRDLLGLPDAGEELGSPGFRFGANTLWIDHVPRYARSDVWLQVRTPDVDAAADRLAAAAVPFREEVEPYDDLPGYWISDPSGVIIRLSPE
jgi:catechol 2,3-dioxygenase-like lactoylglutathione lyase family enzyme